MFAVVASFFNKNYVITNAAPKFIPQSAKFS